MCYSLYLFKNCHRCRYRNQTVVSKVHTGLMTYENSRVSSRWGNSQWNFTATGISALFARLRVTYYSERYGCFFELFLSLSLFFMSRIVIKTTVDTPTPLRILFIAPWKIWRRRKKGGEKLRGHDFESVGRNVHAAKLYPRRK